jgi:hypothetical protein
MYSWVFYTQVRQYFVYLFSIFPFLLLLESSAKMSCRCGWKGDKRNEAWPVLCGGILG